MLQVVAAERPWRTRLDKQHGCRQPWRRGCPLRSCQFEVQTVQSSWPTGFGGRLTSWTPVLANLHSHAATAEAYVGVDLENCLEALDLPLDLPEPNESLLEPKETNNLTKPA